MKTRVLPAPNGMPARIDQIQWMEAGAEVQLKINCPNGQRMAAMQTTETAASGGRSPVVGSTGWAWMRRRRRGSTAIAITVIGIG